MSFGKSSYLKSLLFVDTFGHALYLCKMLCMPRLLFFDVTRNLNATNVTLYLPIKKIIFTTIEERSGHILTPTSWGQLHNSMLNRQWSFQNAVNIDVFWNIFQIPKYSLKISNFWFGIEAVVTYFFLFEFSWRLDTQV